MTRLEDRLRDHFRDEVAGLDVPDLVPAVLAAGHRARMRKRLVAAACTAALAAGVAGSAIGLLGSGPQRPAVSHPHPRPAARLVIVSRTHLGPGITKVAAGYGGVWVVGIGVIYRVDPATGKTVAGIPAPGANDKLSGIAVGAGAVWVTASPRFGVYRIDPRRDRVTAFIRLPPVPTGITVAYGRVWVTEPKAGPGTVVRIDPQTNRVTGPPIRVGTGAAGIVAGFGSLWVTNGTADGSVSRINPAAGAVTRTLANIPDVAAAGHGSLWVRPNYGGLRRVDPATGKATASIALQHAAAVTFWGGSAWVSLEPPGTLVRIDPASNRIIGKAAPAGTSPGYIAASPSGLWVVDLYTGDLLHLALAARQLPKQPDRAKPTMADHLASADPWNSTPYAGRVVRPASGEPDRTWEAQFGAGIALNWPGPAGHRQ